MLHNYFTIAVRALRRHLGYSAINVVGLAVGLAVCLVIALYIRHELQYDRFHGELDRIHRVVQATPAGDAFGPSSVRMLDGNVRTPPGLAYALAQGIAGVAQATVVNARGDQLLSRGTERIYVDRLLRADTAFFEVFDGFDVLRGDPRSALDAPGGIVLTTSLAERLFGAENPVGQPVLLENEAEYTVTGVVADPPSTSHLQFEAIRSLAEGERGARYGGPIRWRYFGSHIYLVLDEDADPRSVERAVRDFEQRVAPDWKDEAELRLQLLTQVHLYSEGLNADIGPQGDIRYLYFFGLIGALILGIASINYMNLATARSTQRAREVAVRKTVGAGRPQLVRQFLGEAVLIAALALPVALGLAQLALPVVNDVAGTALRLSDVPLGTGVVGALGLVVCVGLGAGSYPAFALARFRPAEVLMQTGTGSTRRGSAWLRKGLVVAQFAASVALILATLVVHAQLDYVQTKQLGFDEERVITFDKEPLGDQYPAFKTALQQQAAVTSVSAGPPAGIGHKNMTMPVPHPETGEEQWVTSMFVDYGYIETLGLTLKHGRSFTPDRPGDVNRSVVLSEAAVAAYGVEGNPVGQQIPWGNQQRTVIGVVEDFHNESLHEAIQPIALALNPESTWTAMVRLAPGATETGLDAVRATWGQFLPDRPFAFSFLDQRVEAQYRAEQRLATLFGGFAGLAVVVAVLGLVGLAAFMAQQRTKEIGIRKALGASVASIVGLLSREFVALVAVAVGLGAPVAYWAMQQWMQNFAFRARMGAGLFLAVGGAALAVILLAVGYHATRAALTDPARALRDE